MSAAQTINLVVVHEVIWNVYAVYDTVPTYTVCSGEKIIYLSPDTTQCSI